MLVVQMQNMFLLNKCSQPEKRRIEKKKERKPAMIVDENCAPHTNYHAELNVSNMPLAKEHRQSQKS